MSLPPPKEIEKEIPEEVPEPEEAEVASFDPDGWTDLWLTAKYRLLRGPIGQVAVFGGVKVPVGETRVIDSAGLRVEPASTAGTGSWDWMAGAAYTFAATPALSFDASAQYTVRGEKYDYEPGDRFDAGVTAAWRVWGRPDRIPSVCVVGEASVRHIAKSREGGIDSEDSGGTAVFVAPGLRVSFGPHIAWMAGVQIPVLQALHCNQIETRFRVSSSLSFAF